MKLDVRVLEVDPIQRRSVLGGDEHSRRTAAASRDSIEVIPMESDDYNMSDPIPMPAVFEDSEA